MNTSNHNQFQYQVNIPYLLQINPEESTINYTMLKIKCNYYVFVKKKIETRIK